MHFRKKRRGGSNVSKNHKDWILRWLFYGSGSISKQPKMKRENRPHVSGIKQFLK